MANEEIARVEWDAWHEVIAQLKQTRAITQSDGESPASARNTKGQRLMAAVRAWGRAYGRLAIAEPAALKVRD